MKKLTTLFCSAFLLLSAFSGANASENNDSAMQHYAFSYNFVKTVDPITHQYSETRQELDYLLALDIQRQVLHNLSPDAQLSLAKTPSVSVAGTYLAAE